MLYTLFLSIVINGNTEYKPIESDLSQEQCVAYMLVMNKEIKSENSEMICQNDQYTLVE